MPAITLITGNENKLRELRAVFPAEAELAYQKLDIAEIQGERADPREILQAKLHKAYELLGSPVIVEDVSAELACHNGLPGPFVKFYEQRLGKGALWQLARNEDDKRLTIRCIMGYFDGSTEHIVEGVVNGTVVPPRGDNGFGFDFVFQPDGETRTTAEMTADEKNAMSWRGLAARSLAEKLFD